MFGFHKKKKDDKEFLGPEEFFSEVGDAPKDTARMEARTAAKTKEEDRKSAEPKRRHRGSISGTAEANGAYSGSAAYTEFKYSARMFLLSTAIILAVFLLIEALMLVFLHTLGDPYWHLLNLADNVLAFIVGLAAMDAVLYIYRMKRTRRNEARAIIRHNRLVQPAIDMYLARKNMVVTPTGRDVRKFQVTSTFEVRDMKDMYGASLLIADAGATKIEMFKLYEERLTRSMSHMAEDIDFSFNPELCDAVLRFINASTYGESALTAVLAYGSDGSRSGKMTVIRLMKDEPTGGTMAAAAPELKNIYLVQQMIRDQERALRDYLIAVKKVAGADPERKFRSEDYE